MAYTEELKRIKDILYAQGRALESQCQRIEKLERGRLLRSLRPVKVGRVSIPPIDFDTPTGDPMTPVRNGIGDSKKCR